MPIDVICSHLHYWHALSSVWREIPDEHRGVIYAAPEVARMVPGTVALAQCARMTGTPLVAGHVDLKRIPRGRQVIMMEHGVGQSYGASPQARRNAAYAGGEGRGSVGLFLHPNEYAGARDRARYPHAQVEIIGSPRLAELQRIAHPNNPEPVLAVTTHWPCSVAPEAGSGWGHWYKAWGEYAADGHKVIGTAHPRCFRQLARHYVRMGIEPVEDFTEVMRRADVLAFDSTSAGYEWAGTGRPVVVLDVPWWRTPRGHGLRFDDAADIGPRIMNPDAFPAAVDAALNKRPWPGAEERLARVFPPVENPAQRAAEIAVAYALRTAGATSVAR